jgi:hypothetical protein
MLKNANIGNFQRADLAMLTILAYICAIFIKNHYEKQTNYFSTAFYGGIFFLLREVQ